MNTCSEGENCYCIISPKSLSTTDIIGVEALLRWQNPARGLVSPAIYPNCRRKWIVPIGDFCALPALKIRFGRQMDCPVKMAVNLSARQFKQQNLVVVSAQGNKARCHLFRTRVDREPGYGKRSTGNRYLAAIAWHGHHSFTGRFWHGYSSLNYLETFSHPCT